MGQSQLLFIVLAVIIVGIAVTVGITQFGESAVQANQNALSGDCMSIISKAQSFYKKPSAMGGGDNSFTGVTLDKLKVASSNANGVYRITIGNSGASITCVGASVSEMNSAGTDSLEVTVTYNASTQAFTTTDNY